MIGTQYVLHFSSQNSILSDISRPKTGVSGGTQKRQGWNLTTDGLGSEPCCRIMYRCSSDLLV